MTRSFNFLKITLKLLSTKNTFSESTVPLHYTDDVLRQNSQPTILLQNMICHCSQLAERLVITFLLKERALPSMQPWFLQRKFLVPTKKQILLITYMQPQKHWSLYRGRSKHRLVVWKSQLEVRWKD